MAFYPAVILPASATPAATGNTSPAAGSEAPSVRARSQGDEDTIALGVVAATLIGGTAWYTLRDNAKKPDAVNSNGAAKTSAKTATLDASAEPIETNDPTSPTSITSKTKQETEPTSENVTTYRQGLIAKGVPLCHAKSPTHFYHEEQVGLLCSKHSLNAALDALSYPLITPESYLSKLDHAREQVKLHDPTSVGTSEVSTTHELIKVIMAHMNENHNNVLSQEKNLTTVYAGAIEPNKVKNSHAVLALAAPLDGVGHWVTLVRDDSMNKERWRIIDSLNPNSQDTKYKTFAEVHEAHKARYPATHHNYVILPHV